MGFDVRLVRLVIARFGFWFCLELDLALAVVGVVVEKKILVVVRLSGVAARNSWMLGGVRGWFRIENEERREAE